MRFDFKDAVAPWHCISISHFPLRCVIADFVTAIGKITRTASQFAPALAGEHPDAIVSQCAVQLLRQDAIDRHGEAWMPADGKMRKK